jgi:hypothetical protein
MYNGKIYSMVQRKICSDVLGTRQEIVSAEVHQIRLSTSGIMRQHNSFTIFLDIMAV